MPDALQTNFHQLMRASDLMDAGILILPGSDSLDRLAQLRREQPAISCYVIADGDRVLGYIMRDAVLELLEQKAPAVRLKDVARADYLAARQQATLFDVMAEMRDCGAVIAFVMQDPAHMRAKEVKGIIARPQIAAAVTQAVELFS
jgi:predicted transcriptional regulator